MAGTPFKQVQFNARSEILSSDLQRAELLGNTALQTALRNYGTDAAGTAISGMSRLPSLTPIAASFTMDLGAGAGFFSSGAGVGADDSNFQVVEFPDQVVTFDPPSGSPRIDLIVATPATVASDPQSRQVLVDPVARTVAPATLDMTVGPVAVIAVVKGTPAGTPVPPAVPSGAMVLFEVAVPIAAVTSADFFTTRRAWRLALNPFSVMNGIVKGCTPMTDITFGLSFPGTNDPYFLAGEHIVIIDGEVISFAIAGDVTQLKDIEDASNPPFTGVTVSTADKPFFQYIVGGRNAPTAQPDSAGLVYQPVEIVESLTPPNLLTGHPSAPISYSRGTTTKGAIYCGLGFAQKTTATPALRKPTMMIGDKVYAANDPFESIAVAGAGPFTFTLDSAPPAANLVNETPVSKAVVELNVEHPGASASGHRVQLTVAGAQPSEAVMLSVPIINALADQIGFNQGEVWWSKRIGPLIDCIGAIAGDTTVLRVLAYPHNVNRLDFGAGVVSY